MPFTSKAQQRFMFAAEADGKLPKGTARRWARHTKNIKKLPEKVSMSYAAGYAIGKQAAEMGRPGATGTFLADTLGRVGHTLGLVGPITGGAGSYQNPREESRQPRHEESLQLLAGSEPEALSNTQLRLGMPNVVEDLVWRPDSKDELPWYKQIGGRLMQNPRTGPLGKLTGAATYLPTWALTSLFRSPHYNPETDVAHQPWHVPAVTEHELGHAIDFNSLMGDGKMPDGFWPRQGHKAVRDLYGIAARLPFVNLYTEAEANRHSRGALDKAQVEGRLSEQEHFDRTQERLRRLPGGYGSYVGNAVDRAGMLAGVPPTGLGALIGALVGRQGGEALRAYRAQQRKKQEQTAGAAAPVAKAADCHVTTQENVMQQHIDKMAAYLHHLADCARTGPARTKQASLDQVYKLASAFGTTSNLTTALARVYPNHTASQRHKMAADLVHHCCAWHEKVAAVVHALKYATVMMGGAAQGSAPAAPGPAARSPAMAPSRSYTAPAATGGGVSALAAAGT